MRVIGQHSWKDPQFRKDANFLRTVPKEGIQALPKPLQGPRLRLKKNVTLTLKVSDARNVCSHLAETYSYNSNRDASRSKCVRKLRGLLDRAEQINRGATS